MKLYLWLRSFFIVEPRWMSSRIEPGSEAYVTLQMLKEALTDRTPMREGLIPQPLEPFIAFRPAWISFWEDVRWPFPDPIWEDFSPFSKEWYEDLEVLGRLIAEECI